MKVNDAGLALIKSHEGLRLEAYKDPVGIWTIGYGHTAAAGEPEPRAGMKISKAEAETILRRDLGKFEQAVTAAVKVPINGNKFSALVSFCFNVGETNFRKSSVLTAVNARNHSLVPGKLALWNKAGRKVLPGLTRRRKEEAELFQKPTAASTVPVSRPKPAAPVLPVPKAPIPASVPVPEPETERAEVLMVGAKGPRVTALQTELSRLNYWPGGTDGIFGNLTRDAVLAFQADNGLETDGKAGEATWAALKTAKPRPLMTERKTDTLTDLQGKGSVIADGAVKSKTGAWAAIVTGVTTVGAKITEHASDLVNLPLDVFRQGFETWGPWLFGTAIIGAGVFFLWQSRRVGDARLEDHRDARTL